MGRQVGFHALPDDLREFLEFATTGASVTITLMDSDRPEVESLADPAVEKRVLTLWNRDLVPILEREVVKRPGARDYYRIPYSLLVLELSPSRLTSWNDTPALLQGRLYGFSFDSPESAYAKWYTRLRRWIESHFSRNPVKGLDGYVGTVALGWFREGGVLLPSWSPPITPEWLSFVDAQADARAI